jgi:hypothetical protein
MRESRSAAASLLVALWCAGKIAAEQNPCRSLKDQRDNLSTQAMAEEIALARKYREQICPKLAAQAEHANANESSSEFIDYSALIACRKQAETRLEKSNKVIYRNRLNFTFYTDKGAALAKKADLRNEEMEKILCPQDAK